MLIESKIEDLVSMYPEEDATETSLIIDLRKLDHLVVYPIWGAYDKCHCKKYPAEVIYHCPSCGATDANLKSGLPTYDFYSTVYKAMDIFQRRFNTISFVSKEFIPTDFVGSLNRNYYTYLEKLPYRRNIMHISNDVVHGECMFVQNGILELKRDILTHITIFSSNKSILQHHMKKIIHASSMEPSEYLNLILSSSGVSENYLIS